MDTHPAQSAGSRWNITAGFAQGPRLITPTLLWSLIAVLVLIAGCRDSAGVAPPAPSFYDSRCRVAPNLLSDDDLLLPATSLTNQSGRPLVIVALGSSSTAGVGATSKSATYPAVLERELRHRLGPKVRVLNRGIGGETVDRTAARIDVDVAPFHPTLVVWQTGTNDLLRSRPPQIFEKILAAGILRMRQHGIDVILMSPQYFPAGERRSNLNAYLRAIDRVGELYDVPVLHRHQIMAYWAASGELTVRQMLARDLIHMSDDGYRCLGEVVADFILRHCAGSQHRKSPSSPIRYSSEAKIIVGPDA
jgi:acyl-CoA thioesterase-1